MKSLRSINKYADVLYAHSGKSEMTESGVAFKGRNRSAYRTPSPLRFTTFPTGLSYYGARKDC